MPKILGWLTKIGFWLALFLPASLIPVGGYGIGTEQVSFTEFWQRGGGPAFFLAGILFPLTSYGFLHARNWARYLYAGMHIPLTIWMLVDFSVESVFAIGWMAFVIYYLFFRENVRAYFGVADHTGI